MNTRFCPACGKKHVFTTVKPTICENCGCDMNKAFASAAIVVPAVAPAPSRSLVSSTPAKPASPFRSSLNRRPVAEAAQQDGDDEGYDESFDQNEAHELVAQWSQEVDASMFFSETTGGPIKLGSLENVREAAEKMVAKPKRVRKTKS